MRALGLAVPMAALLAVLAVSWPALAAPPAEQARGVIQELEGEARRMASDTLSLAEKRASFRRLLDLHFDMTAVSRFILGRHWRATSPGQRAEFTELFTDLVVETWVRRFDDYQGDRLRILGTEEAPGGDWLVHTVLPRAGGKPIAVAWRLTPAQGGMKVVDVIAEGVSMAITRREEIASAMRYAGIDGLLDTMRRQLAAAPTG